MGESRSLHQHEQGHDTSQDAQQQKQWASVAAGSLNPSTNLEAGDLSNIPASDMLSLFKQFLETVGICSSREFEP
jgi:hypothetical protein